MLKKDRLKQEKKALDDLEKNDPESYAEKIKQLDKDRIEVSSDGLIISYNWKSGFKKGYWDLGGISKSSNDMCHEESMPIHVL